LEKGENKTRSVQLSNIGDDYLNYKVDQTDLQNYDYNSVRYYEIIGDTTTHIFQPIAANDSLSLTITLNGDYNSSSEFASLYIDNEWIAQIDDQNIPNGTDVSQTFIFTPPTFDKWLEDGLLTVQIVNDESVDAEGQQKHSVQLYAKGISWLQTTQTISTQIPPKDTSTLFINFNATNLAVGTYEYILSIITNIPNFPVYNLPCKLVVGEGSIPTNEAPIANFRLKKTTINSSSISFLDVSENNPTSWLWDFGDGKTSIEQHPTHNYGQGLFDVSLKVCNDWGCSTKLKENYIKILFGTPINDSRFDKHNSITALADSRIFPNPTRDLLFIYFPEKTQKNKFIQMKLINYLGQTIMKNRLSLEHTQMQRLPITHLPKGIYYIILEIDGVKKVEKVVFF